MTNYNFNNAISSRAYARNTNINVTEKDASGAGMQTAARFNNQPLYLKFAVTTSLWEMRAKGLILLGGGDMLKVSYRPFF